MNLKSGYTLMEILLVISIIGVISIVAAVSINSSRSKARDATRIADMGDIREALGWFYRDNGRYPGASDSISITFEYIGTGDDIDTVLAPYFNGPIPIDPLHDGVTYYYAYDPVHLVTTCGAGQVLDRGLAVSVNRFEGTPTGTKKETCVGTDGNINNADFNFVLWPEGI